MISPEGSAIEETLISAVQWLRLGVETIGACIIAAGVVAAIVAFARHFAKPGKVQGHHYRSARRVLAHYLAIALEFQLAADILSTAVAPTWDQIGKLAAIAIIRTALNYFLSREMREEPATE